MASQQSPNGPLAHHQHYPPAMRQPPNGAMPIQQPQQSKTELGRYLTQVNEETWLRIGSMFEALGDLDGATQAYERAMHHNNWSVPAMLAISCILRSKDQFNQAVEYLRSILKLEAQNGEVWSSLGHCYLMMDDLQQAYSAYQQALYHLPDPKEPKLWYGIGILYDRYGSLEHAEEAFSQVMRMEPGFEKANEIYFRLGIIYKQQQKFQQSLECFRYIVNDPPRPLSEEDIWFQIGHVHEQQKDYDSAKSAYTRVLERDPHHAKVLQQLGWLHHQQSTSFSSQEQAIEYLEKSVNSDQTDAQSWYLLGRCYMSQQKYPKAYEAYQQAVYRDGRNPTFWCSIGVLYYQINQYRDALDAYSRAIRLNPNISEVWYDLGTLYESCNNQTSDALDAYSRAADLDPNNVHIKARLALLKGQPTNGLPSQAGAPLPQDVHPQAYQQPGALGAPTVPWGAHSQNPPPGPAPPPLAPGGNWGSNRLAEMQNPPHMQPQPPNHYDQRDRGGPGPMRQSPPRMDQSRQYSDAPGRPPPPSHRGLSPSPKGQPSAQQQYQHPSQHQSHPSLHGAPPPGPSQLKQEPPPRGAYGAQSSHAHTPSNSHQTTLPPYARPAEPPSEIRSINQAASSPSAPYARAQYEPHPGAQPYPGGGARPQSTGPLHTEAPPRERDERPSSTAPPKRVRDWEEESNSSSKKASTEESRAKLDDIKVHRPSPPAKVATPPNANRSSSEGRRLEEQQPSRPTSAYHPSEAAHHQPTLPSVQTITQQQPPPSAAPVSAQEDQRPSAPPAASQPTPVYEPAARKMDVDENYDDSGDDKSATKQESQRNSPKTAATSGTASAASVPAAATNGNGETAT